MSTSSSPIHKHYQETQVLGVITRTVIINGPMHEKKWRNDFNSTSFFVVPAQNAQFLGSLYMKTFRMQINKMFYLIPQGCLLQQQSSSAHHTVWFQAPFMYAVSCTEGRQNIESTPLKRTPF